MFIQSSCVVVGISLLLTALLQVPAIRVINLEQEMKRYVPDFSEITSEKIIPFVQSYLAGELEVNVPLTGSSNHYVPLLNFTFL